MIDRRGDGMKPGIRLSVVLLLAVLSLLLTLWCDFQTYGSEIGEFGLATDYNNLTVTDVTPGAPAAAAGIRLGDQIDRQSASFEAREFLFSDRNPRAGARMSLRITHAGTMRAVTLIARPVVPLSFGAATAEWLAKCVGVLFISIGALLVLLCPGRMTWAFYFFCLGVHPELRAAWLDAPPWLNYAGCCAFYVLYALGCAGIVVFAARFPDDRSDGWRRIVQRVAPPVFIVELTALTWFQIAYFSPLPGLAWTQGIIDGAAEVAITLAFITLVIRYKRSQNAERPILFWMAVAIGIGGLVTCW